MGLTDAIRYHWALIVGPKDETNKVFGHRFHAKELPSASPVPEQRIWQYEARETKLKGTSMLLARVVIGKVMNMDRLESAFECTPITPEIKGWNCVAWVKEAFTKALDDGRALGTAATDWESVRDCAMTYVEQKKVGHRFDGKKVFKPDTVPTWDMLAGIELVP